MRHLVIRAALPALALAIGLLGLRLIAWPVFGGLDPLVRTVFIGAVLMLFGLALLGSAFAADGARHRNLIAWLSIGLSIGAVAILDRDYADLEYQQVWGEAPAAGEGSIRAGNGRQLADGAIVLERRIDGHFYIDTEINGAPVTFLVDTGASGVALTLNDARRVGIRTETLSFDVTMSTAAGPSQAARVQLPTLDLPGRRFERVEAHVMSGGDMSLLGMTVLERFESLEIRRDQLILRP